MKWAIHKWGQRLFIFNLDKNFHGLQKDEPYFKADPWIAKIEGFRPSGTICRWTPAKKIMPKTFFHGFYVETVNLLPWQFFFNFFQKSTFFNFKGSLISPGGQKMINLDHFNTIQHNLTQKYQKHENQMNTIEYIHNFVTMIGFCSRNYFFSIK